PHPPRPTLFPYTTLFRSSEVLVRPPAAARHAGARGGGAVLAHPARQLQGVELSGRALHHPRVESEPAAGDGLGAAVVDQHGRLVDRKSTRLNSSHVKISY